MYTNIAIAALNEPLINDVVSVIIVVYYRQYNVYFLM